MASVSPLGVETNAPAFGNALRSLSSHGVGRVVGVATRVSCLCPAQPQRTLRGWRWLACRSAGNVAATSRPGAHVARDGCWEMKSMCQEPGARRPRALAGAVRLCGRVRGGTLFADNL